MAGTAICIKQNTNIVCKTANLNLTSYSLPLKAKSCSLWLQSQVEQPHNSNKCNTNDRPMKQNLTNSCINRSCRLDDRILTNYNYNIKTLIRRLQSTKQRPLTLGLAVIIMSLTILLIQMPVIVQSKSTHREFKTNENRETVAQETSAEIDTKLWLSLLAEAQPKEHISPVIDESSSDSLHISDVLRHIQRTQQHHRERRMRLCKRHAADLIITKYLHETEHNLEWKNPCNVDHVNVAAGAHRVTKQQVYQYLKKFERDVGMEYELINAIANTININDMADWSKHDDLYKFLPKLNVNGSIALSRWYRNMQVYVASFGYLARSQYKFDQKKRMFVGSTSEELNKLLASARFILCELETTINGSAPNNNLKKLRTINRKAMNSRLDFVTKYQLANGDIVAANTVDLKFAKYSYYRFLLNMQNILNYKLNNKANKYGIMESREENNSNSIVEGDDTSSLDFSSIFKSDSSLSLGESVEILLKTTKKPRAQRHRTNKRKTSKSVEA